MLSALTASKEGPPLRGPGLGGAIERRPAQSTGREALFAREIDRARVAAHIADRQAARAEASDRHEARRSGRESQVERPRPERGGLERSAAERTGVRAEVRGPIRGEQPESVEPEVGGIAAANPAREAAFERGEQRFEARPVGDGRPADPGRRAHEVAGPNAPIDRIAAAGAMPVREPSGPARVDTPASPLERTARPIVATRSEAAAAPPKADRVLEQLAEQIRPGLRQALVVLDPAELGRVAIRVRVVEGGLAASLRAESPETLALIERHLPELRAQFAAQGLELVSLDTALDSGGGRQQADQRGTDETRPRATSHSSGSPPKATPTRALERSEGVVDTLA